MANFLTPLQRSEFLTLHKTERMRRFADRIKTILLLDSGWTYEEIAEALFLDDSTVRRYHQAYVDQGLTGLVKDAYKGGLAKLTVIEETELKEHLAEVTYASTKEIVAYVLTEFDAEFTIGGMRHLLRRMGFSYIKPKVVPGKANPARQEEFVTAYEALKENLADDEKIYFADAAHPIHNAVAGYGWMLKGNPKDLKTNAGRHRLNLNGAVDPVSLEVVVRHEETINSRTVIALLKDLEKRNPNAKKIYFICDNARYYTSKEVASWLKTAKIRIINLPPYSPNLNIIERLWKFYRQKIMANTYYETLKEFRSASGNFFRTIRHHKIDLQTLLADNFEILGFV